MICPGLQWNGEEIGEIGMSIALAGELEVPVIVVSGDGGSHVS
jgi:D-aminopeptidase